MLNVLTMLAVLVPGVALHEQPHLPDAVTSRAAVELELKQAMAEAEAATLALLAQQEAVRQAEVSERRELVSAGRYGVGEPWATLAECESGDWVNRASFVPGSARWDWAAPGTSIPAGRTAVHHGGLQFLPSTWSWIAPMVGLGHVEYAYQATPAEQVRAAVRLLEIQGPNAWPMCSGLAGMR